MKYTLLEIVQDCLNDMDSDNVNSIDETIESQQVAQIVKTCFNEMISNRNWPHLKRLITLTSSGSTARPTHMKLPDGTKELMWVKYNIAKEDDTRLRYQTIKYYTPEEFLTVTHSRNLDNDNSVLVTDFSATPFVILNDKAPEFWTSFDDEWIVFDSYDSAVSSTLMSSRTQAYAYMEPSWVHEDDAVPDLPEEAFAALVEEVKSTAFLVLKQMPNQKAEQKAGRQKRWLSRKAWKAKGGIEYPNFGRRGRK